MENPRTTRYSSSFTSQFWSALLPGLRDLPGIILLIALLPQFGALLGDPGVGWHLTSGELMVERGRLLREDPFLIAGGPWINTQWLADIILTSFFSAGGGFALTAFCVGVGIIVVSLLLPREKFTVAHFLALVIAAHLLAVQLIVRPVIFSFFFFAVLLKLLGEVEHRGRVTREHFIAIPIIFLLWVQLHPGFVFGLVLLVVFSASAIFPSRYSLRGVRPIQCVILLFLAGVTTLINPWGAKLHWNIVQLTGSSYFMNLNNEWLSPDFHQGAFVSLLFVFAVLLTLLPRSNLPRFQSALVVLFGVLALYSRRYVPFFGIVLYQPLAELFLSGTSGSAKRFLSREFAPSSGMMSVSLAGAVLFFAILGSGRDNFPPDSCPNEILQLLKQELAGSVGGSKIYNHPNQGGCIIWSLWPQGLAFIDDRNELNGEERYRQFFRFEKGEELDQFNFDFALVRNDTILHRTLQNESEWRSLYTGKTESVFKRVN